MFTLHLPDAGKVIPLPTVRLMGRSSLPSLTGDFRAVRTNASIRYWPTAPVACFTRPYAL